MDLFKAGSFQFDWKAPAWGVFGGSIEEARGFNGTQRSPPKVSLLALTFSKAQRLNLSSQFLRVKKEGRTFPGRFMLLGMLKGQEGATKVGFITSKRVGGAVVRNRVRRQLREIVRLQGGRWASGVWLVVIARTPAAKASFQEMEAEFLKLAKRSGFLLPLHSEGGRAEEKSEVVEKSGESL